MSRSSGSAREHAGRVASQHADADCVASQHADADCVVSQHAVAIRLFFPRATSEGFSFSTLIAGAEMSDPRGIRGGNRGGIRTIDPQEKPWIWGGDLVRKYGRNTDEIREVSRDPLC